MVEYIKQGVQYHASSFCRIKVFYGKMNVYNINVFLRTKNGQTDFIDFKDFFCSRKLRHTLYTSYKQMITLRETSSRYSLPKVPPFLVRSRDLWMNIQNNMTQIFGGNEAKCTEIILNTEEISNREMK